MACQVGIKRLEAISETVDFSAENHKGLVSTCMTTLSSKIVGRCKREMAQMCVDAVLAVADLERRDVNLDLIKVDGKVGAKTEDTRLVHGLVLDKDFSHPQMPKELKDVKVRRELSYCCWTACVGGGRGGAEAGGAAAGGDPDVPVRAAKAQDEAQGGHRHGGEVQGAAGAGARVL